jgi:ABC-2 type transport system permease protein
MQSFLFQLIDLTLLQLTNWRWSWRSTLITSVVAPTISTLGLGLFAGNDAEALGYILTGNIVMSLLFGTVGHVSSNFGYMRVVGTLDYLATLPLHRTALILATVFAFMVLSLPPVLVTVLLGTLVLNIQLAVHPVILLVLPLISVALSGLGALIGILARTPEAVSSLSTLTTFVLLALGPVMVPASRLPGAINTISLLSPATYAASALRQVVLAMPDHIPLVVDIAVLMALAIALLWLAGRRMDWRQA